MADMKLFLELMLKNSGFKSGLNSSGADVSRFSQGAARSLLVMKRGAEAAWRGIDRLGNRYTALLTGAAGIGAARQVMALEQRFTRFGIQADISGDAVSRLKQRIFEVSSNPDIRLDPAEITAAIEEIVEKTGDLKYAEENIRNIGLAIQATGSQGQSIGGIMAEFQKMGLGAKESFEALEILTAQGKQGAFTLQNLAALGPRVVTAYTSMGRGGVTAIREMGAALQVIRMGTGSSEQAATAFEAIIRTFGDAKKVGQLQKGGIQIFDPVALKQGKEILRPINELIVDIVKQTKGKKTLLSKVFDAEAIRAFNATASEFQRSGSVESLNKFYRVAADGSIITRDSARAAGTANSALENLLTTWKKFSDNQLSGPIRNLTEALDKLEPGTVERWMNIGKYTVMAAGALIAARKAYGLYQAGRDLFRGGKGGVPGGGPLGGFGGAGPVPVYVVNKPGLTGSGGYDPYRTPDYSGRRTPPVVPPLPGGAALLKMSGLAAIAGLIAGWGAPQLHKLFGGTGDYLEPGTFPGESGPQRAVPKNDIKIDIQIDDRGRVTTKTNGMSNTVNTMKRGSFFDAITAMPAGY
jgi:hypothetical protein